MQSASYAAPGVEGSLRVDCWPVADRPEDRRLAALLTCLREHSVVLASLGKARAHNQRVAVALTCALRSGHVDQG